MRVLRFSSSSATPALAAVVCLGLCSTDTHAAALRLNGWYPCGFSTPVVGPEPLTTVDPHLKPFECAEVDVPLCHEGVCESDREISLFIKRLRANTTAEAVTGKSLWMLQGGPGGSSAALETSMLGIHRLLQFKASLYTVDHRGTGRSFFLQCDAAQGFASGSPSGVDLSADELPDCLRDVLFQIDNQTAAFSVTSAAKDVQFLTDNLHNDDEEVYVYGASYGTYLTERLMHLAPSKVKGYILDGVVAEDAASFTSRNSDNVIPTKRLAEYCEMDPACGAMFGKFKKGELYAKWQSIYNDVDHLKEGANACADAFRYSTVGDAKTEVSSTVKATLGPLANDYTARPLLPGLLALIQRCQDTNDFLALQVITEMIESQQTGAIAKALQQRLSARLKGGEKEEEHEDVTATEAPGVIEPGPASVDVVTVMSPILSQLIKASELWTQPSPSWADEMEIYNDAVFPQPLVLDYAFYCLYQGNVSDPSCDVMEIYCRLSGFDVCEMEPIAFTYKTDAYHHKFATIPDHASVLVINGKLDFQTMSDNGVREFENLKGGRGKMLVEMDYGGHCSGIAPTTVEDTSACGYRIIASFVEQSGDVERVDTSCMEELPELLLWSADDIVETFVAQELIFVEDDSAISKTLKAMKLKHKSHYGDLIYS